MSIDLYFSFDKRGFWPDPTISCSDLFNNLNNKLYYIYGLGFLYNLEAILEEGLFI